MGASHTHGRRSRWGRIDDEAEDDENGAGFYKEMARREREQEELR